MTAVQGEALKLRTWVKDVTPRWPRPEMDAAFAERNVNEGFSGGEKKRHEILQMRAAQAQIAILDEPTPASTSTRCGSCPRASTAARGSDVGVLLITHYTRILRYIKPDFVHVFVDGRIVQEGGSELADKLENEGYAAYVGTRRSRRG